MWTDSARAKYAQAARRYATDLTDAEFALIEPRLPPTKRVGRPRTTDLRTVLDAIFYLLRTGCQWAMLPKQFPPKSTVFGYFRRWWQDGTLLGLYYGLLVTAREAAGRTAQPTAGIVDSQSVKTTESGGPRGYDGGKKINGRKRHVLVDTLGLLNYGDGVDGPCSPASRCPSVVVVENATLERSPSMGEVSTIGLDIAKSFSRRTGSMRRAR